MNTISKLEEYKIHLQKSVAFLYNNYEQTEKEFRKTFLFTVASKKKIPRNKLKKGSESPLQ
jgi:hypothetical protein